MTKKTPSVEDMHNQLKSIECKQEYFEELLLHIADVVTDIHHRVREMQKVVK